MLNIVFSLALILVALDVLASEAIEVIAVEYPPFTSQEINDFGISFVYLEKYAKKNFKVAISPLFVPPARAQKIVGSQKWCLSFYPPKPGYKNAKFEPLSKDIVSFGLYRLKPSKPSEPFKWQNLSELKGKYLAILRSNKNSAFYHQFSDAGLKLIFVETTEKGLSLLLHKRVDLAFGDSQMLEQNQLGKLNEGKLQLSENVIHQAQIGFFYHIDCRAKLFKS